MGTQKGLKQNTKEFEMGDFFDSIVEVVEDVVEVVVDAGKEVVETIKDGLEG